MILVDWVTDRLDELCRFEQKWEADHRDEDVHKDYPPHQWEKAFKDWKKKHVPKD